MVGVGKKIVSYKNLTKKHDTTKHNKQTTRNTQIPIPLQIPKPDPNSSSPKTQRLQNNIPLAQRPNR
jgi:hypothetical protein